MTEKKLVKITLEYDNGTSKYLNNEEADEWMERVNNLCVFAHIHNCNPDWTKFKWVESKTKEENISY